MVSYDVFDPEDVQLETISIEHVRIIKYYCNELIHIDTHIIDLFN